MTRNVMRRLVLVRAYRRLLRGEIWVRVRAHYRPISFADVPDQLRLVL